MLRQLLKYYQPYKQKLLLVLAGAVATSLVELFFPLYMRYLMDEILPLGDMGLLLRMAAVLLAAYLFNLGINYYVAVQGRMIGAYIERDLRRELFGHVNAMSFRYFDNNHVGQLVSRIVSDVAEVRELVFLGPNYFLVCIIFMLGTVAILFYLNWKLALLVNLFLFLKAYDSVVTNRRLKQLGRETRREIGNMSAQVTESLNAVRLVQSFNNEALEAARLEKLAHRLLHCRWKNFRLLSHTNVSMVFFTNIINLAIIVVGGILIYSGGMTVSDLVAFLLYVAIFVRPVLRLNALAEVYQKGLAGFARFQELMALTPEIGDAPDAEDAGILRGSIEFKNVTFGYEGKEPVLKDFSLSIAAGESVAFVGSTGAGKSTLCSLLPRFYEIQSGQILIDGRDIRSLTLASLRRNIGIVQQDIFLFSDSVYNNIAYGCPEAPAAAVKKAAVLAEADRFIEVLPEGYDTFLGERGVKLSGGQKQRLAIARVFLKDPPVLILDEATSSLDNETEKAIQESLSHLSRNRTTLVVAHRLATIRNADRIVVLRGGGIAEQGTHEELLARGGEYYRLYTAQFKASEKA